MRAWSVLRQLLAATLCAVLALPACSNAAPLNSSTPSRSYDAATLSKTRVWGSNEKILLHFRATLLVSEKQHWGCANRSAKNVVGSVVTYDYDAFGNLIHSTATGIPPGGTTVAPTPNEFLFAGEQFDSDLGLYYNRARYLNVSTGRFWSMDTDEGDEEEPLSLHKYLYADADPVGGVDPSGHEDIAEASAVGGISQGLDASIGSSAFNLGRGVRAVWEASKPVLAALGIFYGLLDPRSDFAGVTYDFQLAALTGGDFPDISLGVERRVQNFISPQKFTIIRISYRAGESSQTASVFRIKIGDDGSIIGSGGLNIKLYEKSIFFGKLTVNLGLRVDTQLNLGVQFEFGASIAGIAPGVDSSGPVSGQAEEPKSLTKLGVAIRSKKILLNLKTVGAHPELLGDAINIGDDSPL